MRIEPRTLAAEAADIVAAALRLFETHPDALAGIERMNCVAGDDDRPLGEPSTWTVNAIAPTGRQKSFGHGGLAVEVEFESVLSPNGRRRLIYVECQQTPDGWVATTGIRCHRTRTSRLDRFAVKAN